MTTSNSNFDKQHASKLDKVDFFHPKQANEDCLTLSLENIFDISNFLGRLRHNQKIMSVSIFHGSSPGLSTEDVMSLYELIGSLPSLEKLRVRFCEAVSIDYRVLGRALQQADRLRQLDIICYDLAAQNPSDDGDLQKFTYSLCSHPSIREFKLSFSRHTVGKELQSIIEALATVPLLEKVFVYAKSSPAFTKIPNLVSSGLREVSTELIDCANNLRVLKIVGIQLEDDHVSRMARALSTSNLRLRQLSLCNCGLNFQHGIELANLLRMNSTLETIDLSWNNVGDTGCISIAKALEKNTTLQGLYLHQDSGISNKSFRALEHMLKQNFFLKDLWVPLDEQSFKTRVHFYLRLNQAGKRSILRNIHLTRDEWVDTLMTHQNDLSSLYYFLLMKPRMCI